MTDSAVSDEALMVQVAAGSQIWYNYTGDAKCLDLGGGTYKNRRFARGFTNLRDIDERGWSFQVMKLCVFVFIFCRLCNEAFKNKIL